MAEELSPEFLEISQQRLLAGREYLGALESLGLHPQGILWAYDESVSHHVLMVVTHQYDHAGPLELQKLLFKAYNLAATPKDIDPFLVALYSPRHFTIGRLAQNLASMPTNMQVRGRDSLTDEWKDVPAVYSYARVDNLHVSPAWIYRFKLTDRPKAEDRMREWSRFRRNVESLRAA